VGTIAQGTAHVVFPQNSRTIVLQCEPAVQFTLAVQVTGDGLVISDSGGIACQLPFTHCSAQFDPLTKVTLTAQPANAAQFVGWGGACSGSNLQCTVTMDQALTVLATFSGV
jgi:hypothetical protein